MSHWRTIGWLIYVVVLPAAIGVWAGGDWLFHWLLSRVWLLFVALPVAILLVVALLHRWRRRNPGAWRFEKAAAAILLAVGCFWGGGAALHAYRRHEVESFMKSTLPWLDQYKERNGRYPASLRDVTNAPLPESFPDGGGYTSNGETFTFEYHGPGDFVSGRMLTSSHRVWRRAD